MHVPKSFLQAAVNSPPWESSEPPARGEGELLEPCAVVSAGEKLPREKERKEQETGAGSRANTWCSC